MAILQFNSKMVYWEFWLYGLNFTNDVRDYISSIKVTHYLDKPTEAEISVTSKSYIEDIFVEGAPIEIKVGYDKLFIPSVFVGKISGLPDGSAKDMINYSVKALGFEAVMSTEERVRTFNIPTKAAIIAQIAAENGLIPDIQITDISRIPARYIPMQRGRTDMEFLIECAAKWACICWFTPPNTIHFVDEAKAYDLGDALRTRSTRDLLLVYNFGYRNDRVPNNVEKVSWKFVTPKGGGVGYAGIRGANETSASAIGRADYQINYNGVVWRLKPRFMSVARTNPAMFGRYAASVFSSGVSDAEYNLRHYYEQVTHTSNVHQDSLPPAGGKYLELTIDLNEGDPLLRPPRNAAIYSGSLNPKADSADLPNWFYRGGYPGRLKIFETELLYDHGLLKSSIKCSVGSYEI